MCRPPLGSTRLLGHDGRMGIRWDDRLWRGCRSALLCFLASVACTEDDAPEAVDSNGGQTGEGGQPPSDNCVAMQADGPAARRIEARCERTVARSGMPLAYRCTCDTDSCPPGTEDASDQSPGTSCLREQGAQSCSDALLGACGLSPGFYGFCEASAGDTGKKVACFVQEDGTYTCTCPGADAPVSTTAGDCWLALEVCSPTCKGAAGQCEASSKGYICDCGSGPSEPTFGTWCEATLQQVCAPAQ
jgi:hypothetical protein